MLKKTLIAALFAATTLTILAPTGARAQNKDALVTYHSLKPDIALKIAQATLKACQDGGYQVAVAVVDRWGLELVVLRDRFAGPHTVSTAARKAWTAVSFRTPTLELSRIAKPGTVSGDLRHVTNALVLGGGVPVSAAGTMVGGVGVSGAPGPDIDEVCANDGIATVQDELDF